MSKYIDFSKNEELWKEAEKMGGLGQSILEEGIEEGREQGIGVLIESFQELGVSRETALSQVMRKYTLEQDVAEEYLARFWK